MLKAENLTKYYATGGERYLALRNASVEIGSGDCLAIVGKSGSGKSTLMHLLALLDTPTSGSIRFGEADLATLAEHEVNDFRNRRFGFIFQQFFLNGRDTVLENVALPLKIRGVASYHRSRQAARCLAAVGLENKANKLAKELSGGEKQRVCIARALVGEPELIFADEPTGNLDSANGAIVETLLFSLNADRGVTLVIVTHDSLLAAKCPRAVELRDGRIVAQR